MTGIRIKDTAGFYDLIIRLFLGNYLFFYINLFLDILFIILDNAKVLPEEGNSPDILLYFSVM